MTKILETLGIWIGVATLIFFVYESVTLRSELVNKTTQLEVVSLHKAESDKNLKDCLLELKSTTTALQQTNEYIAVLEGKLAVYKEAIAYIDKVEKGKKMMYTVVCCVCRQIKAVPKKPKKDKYYCSKPCVHQSLRKRVKIICIVCGTVKEVVASRAKNGSSFCSSECQANRPSKKERSYTHCQRPGCFNVIWHFKPEIVNGHVRNNYYPNKKYCSRMCAGSTKSKETIEKQRRALLETYRQRSLQHVEPVDNISYVYQNEFATPTEAYD